jgi:hypothetical protein
MTNAVITQEAVASDRPKSSRIVGTTTAVADEASATSPYADPTIVPTRSGEVWALDMGPSLVWKRTVSTEQLIADGCSKR